MSKKIKANKILKWWFKEQTEYRELLLKFKLTLYKLSIHREPFLLGKYYKTIKSAHEHYIDKPTRN